MRPVFAGNYETKRILKLEYGKHSLIRNLKSDRKLVVFFQFWRKRQKSLTKFSLKHSSNLVTSTVVKTK